ncbi:MAG TPA: MlaD family protein [Longimicrobiales bacterium]
MPAERSKKREIIMGALVIAVLVAAFLVIFFLADLRRLFISTEELYVHMPSAAGLQKGSPVWIAGQTVGEVQDIDVRPPAPDTMSRVSVRIEIESRYREHIRRDSQARVTSFSVMGDPVLDISPGTPTAPALGPKDTLRFRGSGSAEVAIERARSLQANLEELVTEARTVRGSARARSAQAARVQAGLARMGREFNEFVFAVQSGPLNTFSDPEFNRILRSLGQTSGELQKSFARAAQRARTARSDAEPALRRLAARADTISRAVQQLQSAIDQSGGGLLIRARTDTAIVKALHGAQAQLDSLIAETKRNPLRFWF